MAPKYRVAVIQFEPEALDVKGNFYKAEGYIRKAASEGCHLAVLPEYHLTSWVPERPEFKQASVDSAAYTTRYQDLARELEINIVPGTICEPCLASGAPGDTDDAELGNVAYFIAAKTGEICGRYQKKNLWHPERPHLTSSGHEPHSAFDTPLQHADGRPVRAGLLICWDLAFPEAFRALIADGADLIIIPSYWYPEDASEEGLAINSDAEMIFLESATTMRAFENTAAVIFCNAGGASGVTMPFQGSLGRAAVREEKMVISEIDMYILDAAERNYKVRQDMGSSGWHYAYTLAKEAET